MIAVPAYLLYLLFLSLVELLIILFFKGQFAADSICIYTLLTTGLLIVRRVECVSAIFDYLQSDFPALYEKNKRTREYALSNNKEVFAALDATRLERLDEYKAVKRYQLLAFVLFIGFPIIYFWRNGMFK